MANKAKFSKREFRQALGGSQGHIGVVAGRLGVDRRTVYRYLDRYPDMHETLKLERMSGRDRIVELAQTNLILALEERDKGMTMFALRHYDRDGVPGAVDIGSLLAPDVVAILQAQGVEPSTVVKEFEELIRAQAEKVELR